MNYITSDGNIKIAYEDLNPQNKKTVVFLHGWPLSHKVFEYQADILPYKNYRIVAADLRGFGESDAPAMGYGYDVMAKDIYNLITKLGLQNIVLAGCSMGGAIAIRYMSMFQGYGVSRLALLGAAALGDIGKLFPDTDEQYRGARSVELLKVVMERLLALGYVPVNVDVTIAAQRPKLRPYMDEMRECLAEAMSIPVEAVNVKATTTEWLGFEGREEGISAHAVCLIEAIR